MIGYQPPVKKKTTNVQAAVRLPCLNSKQSHSDCSWISRHACRHSRPSREASMVKMAYENLPERLVHHRLDGRLNSVVFSTALLSPHRGPLEGCASVAMPFLLFHWAHWHEWSQGHFLRLSPITLQTLFRMIPGVSICQLHKSLSLNQWVWTLTNLKSIMSFSVLTCMLDAYMRALLFTAFKVHVNVNQDVSHLCIIISVFC